MIELSAVKKAFNQGRPNEYWALHGIDLAIEAAEPGGITAQPAQDANLFGSRGLFVLGNPGRQLGHQCPVFLGNGADDGLHVAPESFHHAAQRHGLFRLRGLRPGGRRDVDCRQHPGGGEDRDQCGRMIHVILGNVAHAARGFDRPRPNAWLAR